MGRKRLRGVALRQKVKHQNTVSTTNEEQCVIHILVIVVVASAATQYCTDVVKYRDTLGHTQMQIGLISLLSLAAYDMIFVHNKQGNTHFLLEARKNRQLQRLRSSVVDKKSGQNVRARDFFPIRHHTWTIGALFD